MNCKTYYLGDKKRKGKSAKTKFVFSLIVVFCLVLYININTFGMLSSISRSMATTNLTYALNSSVYNQLTKNPTLYSNLVTFQKADDGSIASLETNQAKLLKARAMLVSDILKNLNDTETMQVKIPIGNLTNVNIFSGKGPSITVNTILTKTFNAYFESIFTEVGINQSLYQINFIVSFDVDILLPSSLKKVEITQSFPVMSTVIVGKVPDAYTEIHRLTDDITESDIDDIYDFGAK